jgi:hypothetical protein
LQIERLQNKVEKVAGILNRTNNDWEQTLFISMASCFGIPLNQLPFEMLANSIPVRHLLRIKEDLFRLEAWLFGMAGFLTGTLPSDYYSESLLKEFNIIKPADAREEIPWHLWKFMRLRPGAFPTVRLALLASLIHQSFPLMEKVTQISSKDQVNELLKVRASDYWNTHYLFGKQSPSRIKYTGRTFIDTVIINAIVPVLFAMGQLKNQAEKKERAIHILEDIAAEKNNIIKKWEAHGIEPANAFESQALIQLHNFYCKQKRCLDCRIGYLYLSTNTLQA